MALVLKGWRAPHPREGAGPRQSAWGRVAPYPTRQVRRGRRDSRARQGACPSATRRGVCKVGGGVQVGEGDGRCIGGGAGCWWL